MSTRVGAKQKGYIKNMKTGVIKPFMYNPSNFSDSRNINFTEMTGIGSSYPKFQYLNGSAIQIDLSLFFYSKRKGDIEEYYKFLEEFEPPLKYNPSTRFLAPPTLLFVFGKYIHECILLNRSKNYEEFDTDLGLKLSSINMSLKVVG